MEYHIEKIPLETLTYEQFVKEYLLPEKPVVITGVDIGDHTEATPEFVKKMFAQNGKKSIGWYDLPLDAANEIMPDLVGKTITRSDMSLREHPVRIFMQPDSHQTLYHYDGNSLHGFNLQIKGKKNWSLISPNTPPPSPPLMFISLVNEDFRPDPEHHDFYEFSTQEGEMLFLPRYWIHAVGTEAPVNINYNWVFTPVYPNNKVSIGRRESELLFLRKSLPLIERFLVDNYDEYGGRGAEITEKYIASVGYVALVSRILKELSQIPKTLLLFSEINSMAQRFKKNNFNL